MTDKATENNQPAPPMGVSSSEGLGPLPTIPPGETDAEFVAQIEATHCRPLTPPERMPQYIRDELPDELAAHRLQAWADARVAAERERCAKVCDGVALNPSAGDDSEEDAATLCARLIRGA